MRPTLPLLILLATALTVPASAQDDGCTDANPCPWVIELDEDGFVADSYTSDDGWTFAEGDVYAVDIFNDSNETHRLVLDGYDTSFDAPGWDTGNAYSSHGTITFDRTGTFRLTDETTGDAATITVEAPATTDGADDGSSGADGMDGSMEDGADGSDETRTPMAAVLLVVLSVLAVAALIRVRRR